MIENNPFQVVYNTEKLKPEDFVRMFSPLLLGQLSPLFERGNVVIQGTQGTGKSMLLSLFKSDTRLAYHEAGVPFPVDASDYRFVAAGINLLQDRAFEVGTRLRTEEELGPEELASIFIDHVNFHLVRDLIRSIRLTVDRSPALAVQQELRCDDNLSATFTKQLKKADCWFGYFDDVETFDELDFLIKERIRFYRQYANFGLKTVPGDLRRTRTSAGEPLSETVRVLREVGILGDSEVIVRVDQYEELHHLADLGMPGDDLLSLEMKAQIHKMMGVRDHDISYRLAARNYAWPSSPVKAGTGAVLEMDRDYRILDLNEQLRIKENTNRSTFRNFATDVFERRLEVAGWPVEAGSDAFSKVLGPRVTPTERVEPYTNRRIDSAATKKLPLEYTSLLRKVALGDSLTAVLARGWLVQKHRRNQLPPADELAMMDEPPWLDKYWARDRRPQAILQLAASSQQRLQFWGSDEVLRLSGTNVLAFVTLCREIIGAWLRDGGANNPEWPIKSDIQAEGVYKASTIWFRKVEEGSKGRNRSAVVLRIGNDLREALRGDAGMHRPGHSGFSVRESEVREGEPVADWLAEAVDWGVLLERRHTSKSGPPRLKYYAAPILCPYLQLPSQNRKEPLYLSIEELNEWIFSETKPRRLGNEASQINRVRNPVAEQRDLWAE